MRLGVTCVVALVAVTAVASPVAGADNTPPLADAGVDQTVSPGTTVYLDANGSTDPDGTIDSVSWTIEQPDGGTQTPACQSCRTTEFEVTTTGEYTVTLEVTDNAGATRSDTLYVTVRTEDSPTVSLSGSERVDRDTETTLTADIESGGPTLDMIAWMNDGDVIEKHSISGTTAEPELTHSFEATGETQITAVVYDSLGTRASTTHTVTVTKPLTAQSVSTNTGGGGGGGGSPCPDTMPLYNDGNFVGCRTGADSVYQSDNERVLVDTNDKPGIQLHDGNTLKTYYKDNENLRERNDGSFVVETDPGQSSSEALKEGRGEEQNSGLSSTSGSSADTNSGDNAGGDDNDENSESSGTDYVSSDDSSSETQNKGQNDNNDDSNSGKSDNSGNDDGGGSDGGGGGFLSGLFGGGSDGGGGGGLFGGGNDDSGGDSDDDGGGGGLFGGLF